MVFFVDFSVEKKNNKFHAVIPTPYYILALIKKQKYLSKENVSAFIDFGSGEGLVVSYMRDYLGYKSIYAYELNKFLIERFKKNYEKFKKKFLIKIWKNLIKMIQFFLIK